MGYKAIYIARLSDNDYDLIAVISMDWEHGEEQLNDIINNLCAAGPVDYKVVDFHDPSMLVDVWSDSEG